MCSGKTVCEKTVSNSILGTSAATFDHTWMQHNHALPSCSWQQLCAGLSVHKVIGVPAHRASPGLEDSWAISFCTLQSWQEREVSGETYGAAAEAAEFLGSTFCWLYTQPYGVYFLISDCLSRLFVCFFNMELFCFFSLMEYLLYTPASIVPLVPLCSGVQWMFTCLCLK